MGVVSIKFTPNEWDRLSHAQRELMCRMLRAGEPVVPRASRRGSARVLVREGYARKTKDGRFEATDKVRDLMARFKKGQSFGDAIVGGMREGMKERGEL